MTLMINVSPETARRIADDPEALRRAGELIDAEFGQEDQEEDLSTIPDILLKVPSNDLREAQEEMDSGKWVKGADFLAELRSPLAD